jgi:hypothetical protein
MGTNVEADHSLPNSAEIKNAWSYTSIHPSSWRGTLLRTERNLPLPYDKYPRLG